MESLKVARPSRMPYITMAIAKGFRVLHQEDPSENAWFSLLESK